MGALTAKATPPCDILLAGAGFFALTRSDKHRVPQEAIIGIAYAVSAAAAIMIMDRLPEGAEQSNRDFLCGIGLAPGASDTVNRSGTCLYKSANTDVLGLVAEAAGGRAL